MGPGASMCPCRFSEPPLEDCPGDRGRRTGTWKKAVVTCFSTFGALVSVFRGACASREETGVRPEEQPQRSAGRNLGNGPTRWGPQRRTAASGGAQGLWTVSAPMVRTPTLAQGQCGPGRTRVKEGCPDRLGSGHSARWAHMLSSALPHLYIFWVSGLWKEPPPPGLSWQLGSDPAPSALWAVGVGAEFGESLGAWAGMSGLCQRWPLPPGPH